MWEIDTIAELFCVLYWKGGGIGLCVSPILFLGVDDANCKEEGLEDLSV